MKPKQNRQITAHSSGQRGGMNIWQRSPSWDRSGHAHVVAWIKYLYTLIEALWTPHAPLSHPGIQKCQSENLMDERP